MFETAELGRKVSRKVYKQRLTPLREMLLTTQNALRSARFPVVVLFAGVDGAGKGETVNLLNSWMDPRWMQTRAYLDPSDEEQERPEYWRFWRDLPPRGQICLMLSAWYSRPLLGRVYGGEPSHFEDAINEILAFEETLVDDGVLILKFWMHLGREAQKRRLQSLEQDPLQSWRVTERDWRHWRMYDGFVSAAERLVIRTSTGSAPWHIIEGEDAHYRSLAVGERLLAAMQRHLRAEAKEEALRTVSVPEDDGAAPAWDVSALDRLALADGQSEGESSDDVRKEHPLTVLSSLDMSKRLEKADYKEQLAHYQGKLNLLQRQAHAQKLSTIIVFEGADAAGKGGAIRRIAGALDARHVSIIPIAAPTDEERAHHYLWRFWRHLPRGGRITIFDRSWYGRVLVERVEGFAREDEWRRSYAEINQFEHQLVAHGTVLLKFWIHITQDEQLERFKEREKTTFKRWKLTDEDWRNREKWGQYRLAVHDMVERTSTSEVPWILVEGNDKSYARIKVIRSVCERLEAALG